MEPRVAILMPVRNAETTLQKALNSVVYQTHKNLTVIAIDDQSTDASFNILERNAEVHKNLTIGKYAGERKVFNMANVLNGAAKVAEAEGAEYIARMDADDVSDLFRIEAQVDFMRTTSSGMCGTFAHIVGEDGTLLEDFHPRIPDGDEMKWLTKFNYFVHGSVMMRMDVFQKVGPYTNDQELVEDYDLWLKVANEYRIRIAPWFLYTLRRGQSSTTGKGNEIYNRAYKLRTAWAERWGIQIPYTDLPDYCTRYDSKI